MKNLALEKVDNIDELTQLFSRKKFLNDLMVRSFKLLYLFNIDEFSAINTAFGLGIGDYVLRTIANRIKSKNFDINFRAYRVSGDEFAIIFFDKFDNLKEMKKVGSEIISCITKDVELVGNSILPIAVTCGASFGEKELIQKAQIALKVARKNNLAISLYKDSYKIISVKKHEKIKNVAKFKNALLDGDLVVYYQPIIDNNTNKKIKYEALCRIKYMGELIYPDSFIRLSKELKIYNELSLKIVKKSIQDFFMKEESLSINISMEDIQNRNFTTEVVKIAKEYKKLNNIIFEITESSDIKNYKLINNFIEKIKPYGIRISLDDFGTEYSNFKHLSQISLDYLKIDGVFIRDIDVNEKNYKVVESIVKLCKDLGILTVAEFVSSESIFNTVKEIGVDYSQGFYFGEAMPLEKII